MVRQIEVYRNNLNLLKNKKKKILESMMVYNKCWNIIQKMKMIIIRFLILTNRRIMM